MAGFTEDDHIAGQKETQGTPTNGTLDLAAQDNGSALDVTPAKDTQELAEQNKGSISHSPLTLTTKAAPPEPPATLTKDSRLTGLDLQIDMLRKAIAEAEPETNEQREKRERKERAKRIIAAVGDGIAAMGNLYFTTHGAPSMFASENGNLGKVNSHLDKLRADRETNADKYRQLALKLGDAMSKREATVREMEAEAEKRKIAQAQEQRAAEEHRWKSALQDDLKRQAKGNADKAVSDASTAQAQAKAAQSYYENRAKVEEEKAGTEQAKQNRYSRPASGRSSSAKGPRTTVTYNPDGSVKGYRTTSPGEYKKPAPPHKNNDDGGSQSNRFGGFSIHK